MARYIKLESNVERFVDVYECGDCGGTFTDGEIPLYCPRCGEPLD